jgi:hypothetical protein
MNYIFKSQRYKFFLKLWENKQYFKAINYLFGCLPNITYPLREEFNGELRERGQPSYDTMLRKAIIKYGHYNDIRNWKNVVWRQIFHFIGAVAAFVVPFAAYKTANYFTDNGSLSVVFFMLFWLPHMFFHWNKELIQDVQHDGKFFLKNVVDLIVWHSPGIAFLLSFI